MADMKSIQDIIPASRIIPVCTIDSPDRAEPLARTLLDCGIGVIEITPAYGRRAGGSGTCAQGLPEPLCGHRYGRRCLSSCNGQRRSARSSVSAPACPNILVTAAQQLQMPYLPGISTVSEVMAGAGTGIGPPEILPRRIGRRREDPRYFPGTVPRHIVLPYRRH